MTEILRQNYEETLPKLFDSIRGSDFMCLDINLEMNGLILKSEKLDSWLLMDNWFEVLQECQHDYSVYELGLAIFKEKCNPTNGVYYDVQCVNIPLIEPVFEDPMKRVCDSAKHRINFFGTGLGIMQWKKYDLNQVLYDGVPFMNEERREEAITYIKKYPDFLRHQSKSKQYIVDTKYFPKMIPHFGPKETEEAIDRLRGISKLFDVISETNIPVVGHNLQIKLPLLLKSMVALLPKDYETFQSRLSKVLPEVYDTKFMAWEMKTSFSDSSELLSSHCLYDLHFNFGNLGIDRPCIVLNENSKIYEIDFNDGLEENIVDDENSFCYESGFDAYVSGTVFLKMLHLRLNSCGTSNKPNSFTLSDVFKVCRPFKNKFFSFHVHGDSQ